MASQAPGQHRRKGLTLKQVIRKFATEAKAEAWFAAQRWPEGIRCPRCDSDNIQNPTKHKTMPYRCRPCQRYFSVKIGTPMADSNLPLSDWAICLYLYSTSLKGVSSMRLHRDLGITQKAAWHMAHRVREMFDLGIGKLEGPVEADETFIGGLDRNRHQWQIQQGRGTKGKTPVAGMKDRGSGLVKAEVVEGTDKGTLQGFVTKHTNPDTMVYTDEHSSYKGLPRPHEAVRHSAKEFVNGLAHTNGVESFWAMVKRGMDGVYHQWSSKHLHRYISEFEGRFNLRPMNTEDMMAAMVVSGVGKRLRYTDLIGPQELIESSQPSLL